MPRKTRSRRGKPLYGPDHRDHLRSGVDFFGGGFGDGEHFREDEAIEAWEIIRAEVMLEQIDERPCTRPWAWWHFEDHEPRLCVENVPREPEIEEEEEPFFGCASPYAGKSRDDLHFESQAHYLRRHGLLLKAELAHLRDHPELLEPVKGHLAWFQ